MTDLTELYQELILDHSRHPKNYGLIPYFTHEAEGLNPICGDELKLFLEIKNDIIKNIGFTGYGCAISLAAASLMTEQVKGKSCEEAKNVFEAFHQLMTISMPTHQVDLGKLQVFDNVKNYPMRVKCATLAWHALIAALENNSNAVVTTEEDNE